MASYKKTRNTQSSQQINQKTLNSCIIQSSCTICSNKKRISHKHGSNQVEKNWDETMKRSISRFAREKNIIKKWGFLERKTRVLKSLKNY